MKICSKCVNAAFWVLLVPGCSSLSANQKPIRESSTFQKAKQWAAAGVLGASLVLGTHAAPAIAVTSDSTKIEVNVETDYLVRALDYFEGDVKKTMGAVVRAPGSSVRIDPPQEARDDVLRALYPFKEPEEYATQAAWVGVTVKPEKSLTDSLTEKKYNVDAGGFSIGLSTLDIGLAAVVVSYPFTFGAYQAERAQEEKVAAAKKAAINAKKSGLERKNSAALRAKKRAEANDGRQRGPKGAVQNANPVTDFIPEVAEPASNGEAIAEPEVAPFERPFSLSFDDADLSDLPPGKTSIVVNGRFSTEPTDSDDFSISIDEAALKEGLASGASKVVLKGTLEPRKD
jgi:hypothetical protein